MKLKKYFVWATFSILFCWLIGLLLVAWNDDHRQQKETSIKMGIYTPTPDGSPTKAEVVIDFLQGDSIARDSAWWLESPDLYRMSAIKALLLSKEVADLVPGEDKKAALYAVLYREFAVQRLEKKASDNLATVEPSDSAEFP